MQIVAIADTCEVSYLFEIKKIAIAQTLAHSLRIDFASSGGKKQKRKNKMTTFTFEKAFSQGWVKIEVEAENYKEALTGLIFQVGSEAAAAKYTFISANMNFNQSLAICLSEKKKITLNYEAAEAAIRTACVITEDLIEALTEPREHGEIRLAIGHISMALCAAANAADERHFARL